MYFILGQASAGETPPHNALAQNGTVQFLIGSRQALLARTRRPCLSTVRGSRQAGSMTQYLWLLEALCPNQYMLLASRSHVCRHRSLHAHSARRPPAPLAFFSVSQWFGARPPYMGRLVGPPG